MISKIATAIFLVKLVSGLMTINVFLVNLVHHENSKVRLTLVLASWDMLRVDNGNALVKILN